MKPETRLYHRLKDNLSNCLITRVETWVNLGIPDCLVALKGRRAFVPVELKVVTKGRKVPLRPHQVAFHRRHAAIKCSTFVLVLHVPFGKVATREGRLLLYHNSQILELVQSGVDTAPTAAWPYGSVPWGMLEHELGK